ncbi:MAG: glycosyltransferase [Solirubrobacteraceae bacterium]|nr:glycosyltransferase [Solirubrobacteraceae bacterium]
MSTDPRPDDHRGAPDRSHVDPRRMPDGTPPEASRIDLPPALSRCDLHVHSTASQLSKLGVQRAAGLPECATPPEEVYALAKRRGMDFVTITDHDTIAGALQIADRPDAFLGEELTAWFRGEPQAVHVLCLGITPDDHDWLQAHRHDVVRCAEYLHEHEITTALAHPFFYVEAPLTARHRRILTELFPIWETRNGSRAAELNRPAAVVAETLGKTGVGGTDDHAGVDIGQTFTETPLAYTPAEYLAHIRAGRAVARGTQGSAARWAHAAISIAARTFGVGGDAPESVVPGRDAPSRPRPRPQAIGSIVSRLLSEADVRRGRQGDDVTPDDARAMLAAWLDAVGLGDRDLPGLLATLQDDRFEHHDLEARARAEHERRSAVATDAVVAAVEGLAAGVDPDPAALVAGLVDALVPVMPYAPSAAFLGREKRKLEGRVDGARPRVALLADGIGSTHGVTRVLAALRERGVDGFDVDVIGTDGPVDRRLPAVAEVDAPFYAGLRIGVPSVPALVDTIAEGHYDVVHVVSPGPAGIAGLALAKVLDLPVLASYHTELAAYARLRTDDDRLGDWASLATGLFYLQADVVLTPSPQSDEAVAGLGVPADRIGRWDRGVDLTRFGPERRRADVRDRLRATAPVDDPLLVLYSGRQTREKGVDLLVDAFLAARRRQPRLHLLLAGGGPEEALLRDRLGEHATFLGWLDGEALADAYANADVFLFPSRTDTFGQVILEAQASGLPVVAVDEGGPRSLVDDEVDGLLRPADADALADAVVAVASDPGWAAVLATGGLEAAAERTWDASMERLAEGYRTALAAGTLRAAERDAAADAAHEAARPDVRRRVA